MFQYLNILREKYYNARQLLVDGQALVKLAPLDVGYLPWTSFALNPTIVLNIVNDVIINDRKTILEFGAGISTIYLAKAIQQHSATEGTIISIEDDPGWAEIVGNLLRREKLERHVRQIVAPLKHCSFSIEGLEWYDEGIVADTLRGCSLDLVVVDGPRAHEKGKEHARFPAFQAVSAALNPRCAIVLDDIRRHGEQRVLQLWRHDPKFDFSVVESGGCAICHRGALFNPI